MGRTSGGRFGISGLPSDVEVWINFNDANQRISTVEWVIPSGISMRVWIWNDGNLVYDETKPSGFGDQNVPGNHEVVWDDGGDDPAAEGWRLPDYLTTRYQVIR